MAFILRWPSVLVLLLLTGVCLMAGGSAALVLGNIPVDLSFLSEAQRATLDGVSWLEAGLWLGAGLFFFIAMIRLIRRTQAFWAWLIGFALFGGRWAYAQQENGGLVETVQSVEVQSFAQPEVLVATPDGTESQIVILAVILIVGLLVLAIDAIDRAYWERQAA
ncbi:hypothetical protein U91I_00811 [alpha proteobacterium U9-1i]|nr:hypothetical protein U91I_00811 [alpha proteobacterium U9-1i]